MTFTVRFLFLFILLPLSLRAQLSSTELFYNGTYPSKVLLGKISNDSVGFIKFGESEFTTSNTSKIGNHSFARVETIAGLPDLFNLMFTDKLQADTIFINLLSIPNTPFSNFIDLTSSLKEQLYVPAYIPTIAIGGESILREIRFRVPFPDSLIPKNPLVTYPDSSDLSINLSYKQDTPQNSQGFSGSNAKLALGLDLIIRVKPIIGSAFDFKIPLLSRYVISLAYFEKGVGFGLFKTDEYQVKIPFSAIGGKDTTLFTLPAVSLELATLPTSIDEIEFNSKPHSIDISNYPNPFNPSTTLNFSIGKSAKISIDIINPLGQVVIRPIQNSTLNNGSYFIQLDFTKFGSGVYFARLYGSFIDSGEQFNFTQTMTLIK